MWGPRNRNLGDFAWVKRTARIYFAAAAIAPVVVVLVASFAKAPITTWAVLTGLLPVLVCAASFFRPLKRADTSSTLGYGTLLEQVATQLRLTHNDTSEKGVEEGVRPTVIPLGTYQFRSFQQSIPGKSLQASTDVQEQMMLKEKIAG